jgi:hypothetical protein
VLDSLCGLHGLGVQLSRTSLVPSSDSLCLIWLTWIVVGSAQRQCYAILDPDTFDFSRLIPQVLRFLIVVRSCSELSAFCLRSFQFVWDIKICISPFAWDSALRSTYVVACPIWRSAVAGELLGNGLEF